MTLQQEIKAVISELGKATSSDVLERLDGMYSSKESIYRLLATMYRRGEITKNLELVTRSNLSYDNRICKKNFIYSIKTNI